MPTDAGNGSPQVQAKKGLQMKEERDFGVPKNAGDKVREAAGKEAHPEEGEEWPVAPAGAGDKGPQIPTTRADTCRRREACTCRRREDRRCR